MIRKLMTFIYGFVFVRMLASVFKKKWFFYTHPYVLNGIKFAIKKNTKMGTRITLATVNLLGRFIFYYPR